MSDPRSVTDHDSLATAGDMYDRACEMLDSADAHLWDNPNDPEAHAMHSFWLGQRDKYAAMPASRIIPLF